MNEEEWGKKVCGETDTGYSYDPAKRMEQYRINPVLGYRTAGLRAELETGGMPVRETESLGLANVHKDRIIVDSWEFEKAVMLFTDSRGREHEFQLGAHQTDFHTGGFREFNLVYLEKGTVVDHSQADVAGKLVFIDINQRDERWINFPVYQARLKGVAALIVVQEQGHGEISNTALSAQDTVGLADAPAFSMSRTDAGVLKVAMGEENQVRVCLDTSSTVFKDQETYNIIGTIPGTKEGTILLSAHYDSYFSGFQDDNAAVTMMLGIARAVFRSGYRPKKTLVFRAMAVKEWGVVNLKYDWSADAYEQVFTAKPDWVGKAITDLNFELSIHAHGRKNTVRCAYEYADSLGESITGLPTGFSACQPYPEGVEVLSPIQTWSDDFPMATGGIPLVVNDFSARKLMGAYHHFQHDNENFYQEPVYRLHHEIYTGLILAFDRIAVVPMNFARPFEGAAASTDSSACRGAEADLPGLRVVLDKGIKAGEASYEKIRETNGIYGRFLDRGEEEKAVKLAVGRRSFNRELPRIFKKEQDYFVRLSWHGDVFFPRQAVQENIRAMDRAITYPENHDLIEALEAVYITDNNRYAFLFEEGVYTYFMEYALNQLVGRLKWGAGRIVHHQNPSGLAESLKAKTVEENPDTQEEYEVLARARENQPCCHEDDTRYTMAFVGKLLEAVRKAGQWALDIKKDSGTNESKIQEE